MKPNPADDRGDDTAKDAVLKQALLAQPLPAAEDDLDALTQRVLAQWSERHGTGATAVASGSGAARSLTLAARPRRRRLWLGAASLAAVAAVATTFMLNRPDPALEELMQPDVLSQIAIGEM